MILLRALWRRKCESVEVKMGGQCGKIKREEIRGAGRDGRVKDRDPVAIKMSACSDADAHLPTTHTLTCACASHLHLLRHRGTE